MSKKFMIEFSIANYNIQIYIQEPPGSLDYYRERAKFIDEQDLSRKGTNDVELYIIISKGFQNPDYSIIAFSSFPIGVAGFRPGLHYESETDVLFIGAGTRIKTYRLSDNKLIFEKNDGLGFWSWNRYSDYIIQQAETDIRVFNLKGEELWGTYVSPPYNFHITGDKIILEFEGIVESRYLIDDVKS